MLVVGLPVIAWVVNRCACLIPTRGAQGIGWTRDGKITAGVLYDEYTEASIHASIAIAPKSGLPKGLLRVMFDYPFNQLGVGKIIVQMSSGNLASSNLAQRLGFDLEAVIKGAYPDGDRLIYTMPKDNCRWIS
jgi:RimJ/RimL family protein N-acetyltransferase